MLAAQLPLPEGLPHGTTAAHGGASAPPEQAAVVVGSGRSMQGSVGWLRGGQPWASVGFLCVYAFLLTATM